MRMESIEGTASALARGEVDCEEAVGVDDLVLEPLHNFGLY